MSSYTITNADNPIATDGTKLPRNLWSVETLSASTSERIERITFPLRSNESATATEGSRRLWYQTGAQKVLPHAAPCSQTQYVPKGWRVDPTVQIVSEWVESGDELEFVLENYTKGASIQQAMVRIKNPKATFVSVTVTRKFHDQETGEFLETLVVSETLTAGTWVDFSPIDHIARSVRTTHTIKMVNNDTRTQVCYAAIHGWSCLPTKNPSTESFIATQI